MLKYPGAFSIDIINHLKPCLRKAPGKIIIHAGTNDITNNVNYLSNVKKIVKLVRETSKGTKLCFSCNICRTEIKDIDGRINEANSHLESYCKQQNLSFIKGAQKCNIGRIWVNNKNINKFDLAAKVLHIKERGSKKLAKKFVEFIEYVY